MVQKNNLNRKFLVICGPTASGKTSLSLEIAKKYNGEIISADSMQIYRYLDIGTAKITPDQMQGISHHMIDILDPDESYSVAQYQEQAFDIIDDIISRGKLPIVCGGTGLYVNSLIYNYDFCNAQPDYQFRQKLHEISSKSNGIDELYDILLKLEPNTTIHKNNVKRVIRRIEILSQENNTNKTNNTLNPNIQTVAIIPNRELLYSNINKRVDEMFDLGLVQEFENIKEKFCLNSTHQSMTAIGYKEFFMNFDDETTLREKIKQYTRNYAKRQITWFKKIEGVQILENAKEFELDTKLL
ncbi:MAG: tRNA (adenosine(37)-N6)-dimethylallyltransferase MiaA [Clostridia bacterium]|nr:tRNA (adenosine(37)-N6)-dimethylallyltransferase MiaA [Clostridia bacterium]